MYSYINSVNIFCETSSEAGLPAAIRILPRSAHCCMVLLRPSILAFSSWCCLIIPSRAVRSLRNTDHFFLVTLTPSQNILKKESWQFYFLNSCLTAILVSLFSSISDVIVLAAIVCKSVKEQKIAKGPHVPAMYMNDSHENQWLTNIMSAYYITLEFVFTLQTNSEKPLIRTEGHNTLRLYHTSLHLLPGRVWKHSYPAPDILYGLSENIWVSKLILKKLADCMKKKKKKRNKNKKNTIL